MIVSWEERRRIIEEANRKARPAIFAGFLFGLLVGGSAMAYLS